MTHHWISLDSLQHHGLLGVCPEGAPFVSFRSQDIMQFCRDLAESHLGLSDHLVRGSGRDGDPGRRILST